MSNRPAKITQTEISRTIKGAAEAGMQIGEVRVNHATGEVTILPVSSSISTNGIADIDRMLDIRK
ncbi:hypothetical protein [Chachezhania sediminis]|uniref:hypothetical protein n=1 Tax=Chachezhania sediminis TaxID=2599291 RepID=UPI00131C916D|nr:hypothetical protein [Chachezhania sediminis]